MVDAVMVMLGQSPGRDVLGAVFGFLVLALMLGAVGFVLYLVCCFLGLIFRIPANVERTRRETERIRHESQLSRLSNQETAEILREAKRLAEENRRLRERYESS